MSDAVRAAIIRAAQEAGIDPATALAYADRETGGKFDPTARNSKTIKGLFQMTGKLRHGYGIGDSDDPYEQSAGFSRYFPELKGEMGRALGRDVTDDEAYLGHHFGGTRAGRMLRMDPNTPVEDVFSPLEMRSNKHFAEAGTVGRLNESVLGDIGRRRAKFGGETDLPDFSEFGEAADSSMDFASMGDLPDFSEFGTPA